MKYSFEELTISELTNFVNEGLIDLNPSYQRNFIWSPDNQRALIDTIFKGYPIPNFFIYIKPDGKYEMVDGQQRTKTLYRFINGLITSSKEFNKVLFRDIDQNVFLNYKIPIVFLKDLAGRDSLKEFYVLINKQGAHLNLAEVAKAEFHDTNFLKLANDLLTNQGLINLNLFSEASSKRMNDRSFVEELLAVLYYGVKDKKKAVEAIYDEDISQADVEMLRSLFIRIVDRIELLNEIYPLNKTRYKQKNDFYTLFSFVFETLDEDIEILKYQYRILLVLDRNDKDGRQLIRPSNEDCEALREYANNCITQSNSKKAREWRLGFFNSVLRNKEFERNDILQEICRYFSDIFGDDKIKLKNVGDYVLLDVDAL